MADAVRVCGVYPVLTVPFCTVASATSYPLVGKGGGGHNPGSSLNHAKDSVVGGVRV